MAIFTPPTTKPSKAAQQLLRVASSHRDFAGIGFGGAGMSALCLVKAASLGLGLAPVVSASVLLGMSAYTGLSALRSAKRIDRKVAQETTKFSSHPISVCQGLMPMNIDKLRESVSYLDRASPDFIASIMARRRRQDDQTVPSQGQGPAGRMNGEMKLR